jgi:hypothetical protein
LRRLSGEANVARWFGEADMTFPLDYAGAGRRRIGVFAAALSTLLLALAASGGEAKALSAGSLMGRWCGDTTNYTFTPKQLAVTFLNGNPRKILLIKAIKVGDRFLNVFWKPPYGNTVFQEFSGKGMVQAPNTSGDNGPRREFHRC